jgi:hypothetical protein
VPEPETDHAVGPDGSIIFMTRSNELLRLDPNGKVFVRGVLVDDNTEVYRAFTSWLTDCRCVECRGSLLMPSEERDALELAQRRERLRFFQPEETA